MKRAIILAVMLACLPAEPQSGGRYDARVIGVRHQIVDGGIRVVVQFDASLKYVDGTAADPYRIFFDLQGARPSETLVSRTIVGDPLLQSIRVAQYQPGITRVVLDLSRPAPYSAFLAASPPRLVIEVSRTTNGKKAQVTRAGLGVAPHSLRESAAMAMPTRRAAPTPPAQPPAPPLTPEQLPPSPPHVDYRNGLLTIVADNSTLADILRAVSVLTGATLDTSANLVNQRVTTRLGPGSSRQVLNDLLAGPDFDYILLGDDNDPNAVRSIILTRVNSLPSREPPAIQLEQPQPSSVGPTVPRTRNWRKVR